MSISLIHWSGTIDPSWEPGNSVLRDKVPRLDKNGSMVYPLTLLERGRYHADPPAVSGLTSPCLVPRKSSSSRTEPLTAAPTPGVLTAQDRRLRGVGAFLPMLSVGVPSSCGRIRSAAVREGLFRPQENARAPVNPTTAGWFTRLQNRGRHRCLFSGGCESRFAAVRLVRQVMSLNRQIW